MAIKKRVLFGISIVSALHTGLRWSLRPPGCFFASPEKIILEMIKLGYDGVQMIPIWGLKIDKALAKFILLSQGPWNAVRNLWQAIRHIPGSLKVRSEIKDWIVSPPPETCLKLVEEMNEADIRRVYHDLGEGSLVEVHPGLDMTAEEIVAYCQRHEHVRLVLDLRHLRRPYGQFELDQEEYKSYRLAHYPSPLWREKDNEIDQYDEWRRVIRLLSPFVDVVHVQPGDDETVEQFADQPFVSMTGRLLFYTLMQIGVHDPDKELVLIAEYNPGIKRLLIPWLSRRLAKHYLIAMRRIVEATKEGVQNDE